MRFYTRIMANYSNVSNVAYQRYSKEAEEAQEGPTVEGTGRVDELYFDIHTLHLGLETPEGHISVDIPVFPNEEWNEFVGSLPVYDLDSVMV